MAVTQADVARALNLSQSFVAGVLNDRPGMRVAADTRQQVLETACRLGYRRNRAAAALRSGKTRIVALIYRRPDEAGEQAAHGLMAEVLAERLSEIEYDLCLRTFDRTASAHALVTHFAEGGRCDAVVLIGREEHTEEPARLLAECGFPFIIKGRFEEDSPEWLQADFGHEEMMREAVRQAAALGHTRIAFASGNGHRHQWHLRRGFRNAMAEQGMAQDARLDWDYAGGNAYAAIGNWMMLPPADQPTALILPASEPALREAEMGLFAFGRRFGFDRDRGEILLISMRSRDVTPPFLLGQGLLFDLTLMGARGLAEAMVERLLLPLLCGEVVTDPVVRLVPKPVLAGADPDDVLCRALRNVCPAA